MIRISQDALDGLALDAVVERTRRVLSDGSPSFRALTAQQQNGWFAAAMMDMQRLDLMTEAALPSLTWILWYQALRSTEADAELEQALTQDGVPEADRLSDAMDIAQQRLGSGR